MKLNKISIYQAVEIPGEKKLNMNTLSDEIYPGIKMELNDHICTLSHDDWQDDILVFTTNIRYAVRAKGKVVMTFDKEPVIESKPEKKGKDCKTITKKKA